MAQLTEEEYLKLSQHEDGLINHRLTWLLAGQPLLFLAYAHVIGLRKPGDNQPFQPEHEAALSVIPWVGGLLAAGVFLGIVGAVIALQLLRNRRASGRVYGVSWFTTLLGICPPLLLPVVFMWAWWRIAP